MLFFIEFHYSDFVYKTLTLATLAEGIITLVKAV